ncbi:peptidylprolyl isomerase [Pseudoduganella violaceinigra]|uniref:peptidylprolyl isomerase n=1 Tax=Pseudoduganella violaceinigra TaxID=246602 RepID=UPI0004243E68|nr:peptidylprolyl isomerase [Pseudoduganella violaceinigra]
MHSIKLAAALLCASLAVPALAQNAKPAIPAAPAKTLGAAAPSKGFTPPGQSANTAIDAIAVIVNDEVITQRELKERVATIVARMQQQKVALPDAGELRKQVLERMIVERAQLQLAKEMGVRVDDNMLDRAIARIAEQQKMTVQQLRNQMEKEGTTFASFREEIREEIVMQRLREYEVDNKINIAEAEVDSFVAAEKAMASEQFELNIAQIMVRIPENAAPDVIAQRQKRAEEVLRQLRTGADFAKMAATYSDASDALQGGAVGWRPASALPPLFADALTKLKPGQNTALIKSAAGFHILKLVDKRSMADAAAQETVQQTHARHILLKVTPTMSAADAKRKLLELKERLDNKAAKFEELARLFSNDSTASKGGDLGWLYPGDTVPEFEQAMNGLKLGQVSDPVESSFGYHLIEVLERKSDDVSKEKQRAAARNALRERKLVEAVEDWQRQVRDRAYVEFRDESLK